MKWLRIYLIAFLALYLLNEFCIFSQFQNLIYSTKSTLFSLAGDTKITNYKINDRDYKILEYELCPGDIILTRNRGYISNLFIPGFWTHVGIFIGNQKERNIYLTSRFDKTIPPNIDLIEALSEGVVFSTLGKSFKADNIAVLRPEISKLEVEKVIEKALAQINKNYDFNFDLESDSLIYCTELVYQSYSPYIDLPIKKIFGRTCITANDLYKCAQIDYPQKGKFNLVYMDKSGNQNSKVKYSI